MIEKQIYKETPLKIPMTVGAIISGFLLLAVIFFTFIFPSEAQVKKGTSVGGLIGLGAVFAVMFLTLLILWLAIKKREVTVDLHGVEVVAKRPVGQATVERFLWQNVTVSFLESATYTIKHSTQTSYKLGVRLDDGRIVYLLDKTFLDAKLSGLVRDVNRATGDRLGYVWEYCRADETRPILAAVAPFCKIAVGTTAQQNFSASELIAPNSAITRTVRNPAVPKILTKRQLKKEWLSFLSVALFFWVVAAGLAGWDYYSQKTRWESIPTSTYDFETGKSLPAPKPPFDYRFGNSGLFPIIIIVSAVNVLFSAAAVSDFLKWRRTEETSKMIAEDARLEAVENSPAVKEAKRQMWRGMAFRVLVFSPIIVMLFIKTHFAVYFAYLFIAAITLGIQAYLLARRD